MTSEAVLQTNLPHENVRHGKVRDIYDLGETLLIVATDRISSFDCIMPNGIPDKGRLLTQLSLFWFDRFKDFITTHLISADTADLPEAFQSQADMLAGRVMHVHKAEVVPFECVVRGYLAGSGWKEYQESSTVCGIQLPDGLTQCAKLPEPIFTPATKAESGHDENVSFEYMAERAGEDLSAQLRDLSMAVYKNAADYAASRGVIIADTKFEWGIRDGKIILIDEVLTPDSSRFWPVDDYEAGRDQASFDKQFVRNYLETCDWDKTPPAPALPDEIVTQTRAKYLEAFERLTGKKFDLV